MRKYSNCFLPSQQQIAHPPTFRKTDDLFAIRQFFKEIPSTVGIVFNQKFSALINEMFGDGFFVVKSIYFDKPEHSNWFVAYHQDLTISVDKKLEIQGYGPWTTKQNQFAVYHNKWPLKRILITNLRKTPYIAYEQNRKNGRQHSNKAHRE